MEFGQLMIDILVNVSCKFEMYIFKIAQVINENVRIAFLYVLSIYADDATMHYANKSKDIVETKLQRSGTLPTFTLGVLITTCMYIYPKNQLCPLTPDRIF